MSKPNYYVYVLLRETLVPFYVGLGRGDRYLAHERLHNCRDPHSHKNNIIRDMRKRGYDSVPKMKLAEGLTREEAAALEIATIARLGREPNGPLVNGTPGGDGVREWSEEARRSVGAKVSKALQKNQYRKGVPHSAEIKEKIAAALRGRARPDVSERMRGRPNMPSQKGVPKTAEHKEKIRLGLQKASAEGRLTRFGRKHSQETKAKIAAGNRARAADPKERAKISAALKGRVFSEETLAKMSAAQTVRRARNRAEAAIDSPATLD